MGNGQVAFFRGKFVPVEDANVPIFTHALHYGTAVFEGIRGNWSADQGKSFVFRPLDHYRRLLEGCSFLRISLPYSAEDLVSLTVELLERNHFKEDVYIRPLAYKSALKVANLKLHELEDDIAIMAVPLGNYLSADTLKCVTSSWKRVEESMIPARIKISGLYVNSILAKTDAALAGCDEAILLDTSGHAVEGSGENLFIVKRGRLITPPESDSILEGITRETVMELARNELNLEIEERSIGRAELYLADEVFLTGTAAHVTGVAELDHHQIGTGQTGPVTAALSDLYKSIIRGSVPKYLHWCAAAIPERLTIN
jgi:branched-chain amino acid aminotransferase